LNPAIFALVWSFFDNAMGKAIGGIKGALGLVKFVFLYMHKPSRSSMVCPPCCRPSRFLFEAAVGKQVP
jgi:hypothetical protein